MIRANRFARIALRIARATKKAKSGNLNLFLGIFALFSLVFPAIFKEKKGKICRKRFRLPDFAFKVG